jgi:diketogulonate reductase-like aldo/keto reductase
MTAATHVVSHGVRISSVGLGTWALKGQDCANAVVWAIESGYRHIDTAAAYQNEADVGEGLRRSGIARGDVFVTTKVWFDKLRDGDLQRAAEQSLANLKLDHVDLLLIHWSNPDIPLKESIKALCDAKRRGLTRNIGVSNFTVSLLDQAAELSTEPIIANQCEYHPHLESGKVLAACRKHDVAFTSYCPLGRGSVGGVLDEPVIKEIAGKLKRTPGQVVLRWHVQQPGIVAVPKSGNRARIAENIAVYDFELSNADMARISALARPDGRVVKAAHAPKWD